MSEVKQICISNSQYLIVDQNSNLYACGPKWYHILGNSSDNKYKPTSMDIRLYDGESIEKFHFSSDANVTCCYIYTSSKRLWIKGSGEAPMQMESPRPRPIQEQSQLPSIIETLDMRFNNVVVSYDEPIHFPVSQFIEREQNSSDDSDPVMNANDDNNSSSYGTYCSSEPDSSSDYDEDEIPRMLERRGIFIEPESDTFHNVSLFDILDINEESKLSTSPKWKIPHNVQEPLTDINNVTIIDTLIFFSKNGEHYYFNCQPTDNNSISELFTTVCHGPDNSIVYGKFNFPFDPDFVTYADNFLYIKCGSMNHVFTLFTDNLTAEKCLRWLFFQMEGIDHTNIIAHHYYDSIYVLKNSILYKYFNIIRGLAPVVIDKKIVLAKFYPSNWTIPYFFDDDNQMNNVFSVNDVTKPHPWLEYIIGSSYSGDHDVNYLFVDVDSEKRLDVIGNNILINVHHTRYHSIFDATWFINENAPNGLAVYFNSRFKSNLDAFKNIETTDSIIYCIQCAEYDGSLGELVNVAMDKNSTLMMQTSQSTYYSKKSDPYVLHPFHITHDRNIDQRVEIDKSIIDYEAKFNFNNYDQKYIDVEIRENPWTSLLAIAYILPTYQTTIRYVDRQESISSGNGTTRTFYHDALMSFYHTYLEVKNNRICFNLDAWKKLSAFDMYKIGKTLRFAILNIKCNLNIRLPLEFSVALARTQDSSYEPSTNELDAYYKYIDPNTWAKSAPFSSCSDKEFKEMFGHPNYDSYLRHVLDYETDTENNHVINSIATNVAQGFIELYNVKNLSEMNLVTIDYYLSGDYLIDRELLISNIVDCNNNEFIETLIRVLPEEKLAILLRNWSGTSTVIDRKYKVKITDNSNSKNYVCDVRFHTCDLTLEIERSAFNSENSINNLITILTTPVIGIIN